MSQHVAVLLSAGTRELVMTPETEARLAGLTEVRYAADTPDTWQLPALLDGAIACLTGWGTPPLGADALATSAHPLLVAHTAGSVRKLVPQDLIGDRVRVCQAAAVIADAVAEMVLLQILTGLRHLHLLDRGLRSGSGWIELRTSLPGRLLGGQTVGVVGASRTGRAVLRLLHAFGPTVLIADPTLDTASADELDAELVTLDTLLQRSDVVTLHAPLLESTRHMLGARELALLRDDALLVNSARGGLIDGDALLDELHRGRIRAALDVYPDEPLAPDSPWRHLPDGVVISPHSAGHTIDTHRRQGKAMVDEIERLLRGEPLRHEITADQAALLA